MIPRLIKGGLVLAASQGIIFLLQTILLQRGDHAGVADLAAYTGTISLLFYLLDGNSGIAYLQGLRSLHEGELRSAFLVYRGTVLAVGTAIAGCIWLASPRDVGLLAGATLLAAFMRSYGLDGDLDRRGLQYLATAFANAWLIVTGGLGLAFGRVDAEIVAVGVLTGSFISLVGRFATRVEGAPRARMTSSEPLLHIVSYLGTYGIGQVYGRLSLALLGGWFIGATAAFAIYAKQTMNAVGILNALIRRVELSRDINLKRRLTLADFKWSLGLQAAAALAISAMLLIAAHFAGVAPMVALAIIIWQILEKVSSNQAFLLQVMGRPAQAYTMLIMVCLVGLGGLYAGGFWFHDVLVYTSIESVAFIACALCWIWAWQRRGTQTSIIAKDETA